MKQIIRSKVQDYYLRGNSEIILNKKRRESGKMATAVIRERDVKKAVSGYVAAKAGKNLDLQIETGRRLFETATDYLDSGGSIEELDDLASGKKK